MYPESSSSYQNELVEKYIADGKLAYSDLFQDICGRDFNFLATVEFPPTDPWSIFMRKIIRLLREKGAFDGIDILELGIGDGRNIIDAGPLVKRVIGVDIERWCLEATAQNLGSYYPDTGVAFKLMQADAVDFLAKWHSTQPEVKMHGWTFMCLPQSPEGQSTTDVYGDLPLLGPYMDEWDKYGLPLNAAVLDKLRRVAAPDLKTLLMLSDRVPPQIRERLIECTGWAIVCEYKTQSPIQQDPDTGIHWVINIEDGERFFEKNSQGFFVPLSAYEAEERRLKALASGNGRDGFNVYHHLSVYELQANLAN